jgi:hypothetical protein
VSSRSKKKRAARDASAPPAPEVPATERNGIGEILFAFVIGGGAGVYFGIGMVESWLVAGIAGLAGACFAGIAVARGQSLF